MDIFPPSDASDSGSEGSLDDELDLSVVGYACRTFRDDSAAARMENNEHLHCWNNDERRRILVDRYDVRCLLDVEAAFARQSSHTSTGMSMTAS